MSSASTHTLTVLCSGVQNHADLALCPWRTKGSMSEYEFADRAVIWGTAAALSATGGSEAFRSVMVLAWTPMGTALHRSHDAGASMDSGQLDSTHPSLLL